ncbi:MAG TPA: YcxB family protein [Clostridiales bacterium]|nr:YcxB family protein [Clostridiales bacterium]
MNNGKNDEVEKILSEIREITSSDATEEADTNIPKNNVENFLENKKEETIQACEKDDKTKENEPSKLLQDLTYSLTEAEAYTCLKNSGLIKTTGVRAILYTILMVIAATGFFISYFVRNDVNWFIFGIVALAVIAVIWVFPTIHLKKLAKVNSSGQIIKAKIFTNRIEISGEKNNWKIYLDETNEFKIFDNILLFRTAKNKQIFVIPKRVIDKESYDHIIEVLKNGTVEY